MKRKVRPEWLRYSAVKKVVYHATAARAFNAFDTTLSDLGAHFGTLEQAEHIADNRLEGRENIRIIPVWLNIRRPLRLKDEGSFHADAIAKQLMTKGIIDRITYKQVMADYERDWKTRKYWDPLIRKAIESAGYDGVVYKNTNEGKGDSYIAFHPTQIKSAIGNRGAFDPADPIMTNPLPLRRRATLTKAARRALKAGTRVELEHVRRGAWTTKKGRALARTIASHHLAEFPDYYRALSKMERGLSRRNPRRDALQQSAPIQVPSIWYHGSSQNLVGKALDYYRPRLSPEDQALAEQAAGGERFIPTSVYPMGKWKVRRTYDGRANFGFGIYFTDVIGRARGYGDYVTVASIDPSHILPARWEDRDIPGTAMHYIYQKVKARAGDSMRDQASAWRSAVASVGKAKALFIHSDHGDGGQLVVFDPSIIRAKMQLDFDVEPKTNPRRSHK